MFRKTAISLFAATTITTAAHAEPHRYELDPTHTVVAFMVEHIGFSNTLGIFPEIEGSFTYDMETQELSDLVVTVNTASVNTFNDARDEHVRKDDFLGVDDHPAMTFTATGGEAASDTSGTVTGELTLLGDTRPLTLDVTLNKADTYPFGHKRFVLGLSATGTVKRSEFGMTYGVDGNIVGDDVQLMIETEAMRME